MEDVARHGLEEVERILERILTPARPTMTRELLYGRTKELDDIVECLRVSGGTPFVFGNRGVGKTSLARTAAQEISKSDREPIYVACSPSARALTLFRDVAVQLADLALRLDKKGLFKNVSVEASVSASPLGLSSSLKFAHKVARAETPSIADANEAVRIIKGFDKVIPDSKGTVVVIDEVDELDPDTRKDLAYFVKQIGDQLIETRFILVGIADNVYQLIGEHSSVPRYLRNVELGPLSPQALMDIVKHAASAVDVSIHNDLLYRIAIIGNGYPHFAHLMGLALLIEAITDNTDSVTDAVYRDGVERAVRQSLAELRASYDSAVQRGTDAYRNVLWTIADMDQVDLRTDQIAEHHAELAKKHHWAAQSETQIGSLLSKFKQAGYGEILMAPGKRYGATKPNERRYRYHRFRNNLMRGHVRLRAEAEGIQLGRRPNL